MSIINNRQVPLRPLVQPTPQKVETKSEEVKKEETKATVEEPTTEAAEELKTSLDMLSAQNQVKVNLSNVKFVATTNYTIDAKDAIDTKKTKNVKETNKTDNVDKQLEAEITEEPKVNNEPTFKAKGNGKGKGKGKGSWWDNYKANFLRRYREATWMYDNVENGSLGGLADSDSAGYGRIWGAVSAGIGALFD